jgi:hypothetical protein
MCWFRPCNKRYLVARMFSGYQSQCSYCDEEKRPALRRNRIQIVQDLAYLLLPPTIAVYMWDYFYCCYIYPPSRYSKSCGGYVINNFTGRCNIYRNGEWKLFLSLPLSCESTVYSICNAAQLLSTQGKEISWWMESKSWTYNTVYIFLNIIKSTQLADLFNYNFLVSMTSAVFTILTNIFHVFFPSCFCLSFVGG